MSDRIGVVSVFQREGEEANVLTGHLKKKQRQLALFAKATYNWLNTIFGAIYVHGCRHGKQTHYSI